MEKLIVNLVFYERVKNSVRYKATGQDPAMTSVYIMNTAILPDPPIKIKITIEEA
uniref:Uncharacterized protein n=1 Tax=viral metagenome TaxID=1070528 RepID=A0A6H1ZQP8_9ZZZZ